MNPIRQFSPLFQKRDITLISKRQEINDIMTFVFKKEDSHHWVAGQTGLFGISHKRIMHSFRPFSVASSPLEPNIQISTKITQKPSAFKAALSELEPGMKLQVRGPFGHFMLDRTKPAILIAGGIGITPYRSMLQDITLRQTSMQDAILPIHLLYVTRPGTYLYRDELDVLAKADWLTIQYMQKNEQLMAAIDEAIARYQNDAVYYVSGSSGKAKEIKHVLMSSGIHKKNIKIDGFRGL